MTETKKNTRHKPIIDTPMVYGKVPPQAKELEEAVLGAIMLERNAFDQASELIRAEHFYLAGHQEIFRAFQELNRKGMVIDILTVCEQLRSMEKLDLVGGAYYVTKLTNSVVSSAHMAHHCRIIVDRWYKREVIRVCGELITEAFEDMGDAGELLEKFGKTADELSMVDTSNFSPLNAVMVDNFKRILELKKHAEENDTTITGIPSGYSNLDRVTFGWQKTDLIILAARPSVGKTAFMLNLARNAAMVQVGRKKPAKVAIFSMEMSKTQLVERIMSSESEIWMEKIKVGRVEDHEIKKLYEKGMQPLSDAGIFIDDTPGLNVYQLKARFRSMMRKFGKPGEDWLVLIDYLQLMTGVDDRRQGNREQEISNISRNLKTMAKELEVPVIALSQLSRAVEQRRGERNVPQLSDLRESGALEQDADMVMFLYRPEYHDLEFGSDGESTKGLTEVKIAKHRNGILDTLKFRALLHIQKFIECKEEEVPGPALTGPAPEGLPPGKWRPVKTEDTNELPFT